MGGLRWVRWEGGEVGMWEISDFIQGGGRRVSQRFHLFYVNQGNREGQVISIKDVGCSIPYICYLLRIYICICLYSNIISKDNLLL